MKGFSLYKQPNTTYFGQTALRIIAKYYGKHYNLLVFVVASLRRQSCDMVRLMNDYTFVAKSLQTK